MNTLRLLCLLLLTGCAAPRVFVGVQNVSPMREKHTRETLRADTSVYLNVLFPLPYGMTIQVEPIFPIEKLGEPLLRVACDVELPIKWSRP